MNSLILSRILAAILTLASIFMPYLFVENKNVEKNLTESSINYTSTVDVLIDPSEWFVVDIVPTVISPTTIPTKPIVEVTTEATEPVFIPMGEILWYSDYRTYTTNEITTHVAGEPVNIDFLAKLLFAEAAVSGWMGQVYTCSAILNLCDYENISLWDAGHDVGCFAVAPHVDEMEPTEEIYEVIEYVLNGGRIADICYFRTKRYHSFGSPICQIDGQYFSKP